jgi:hypothetical protein
MFCSVAADLNRYFQKIEADDKAWELAVADALDSDELEEMFDEENDILKACRDLEDKKMTYEELGRFVMNMRNKCLHKVAQDIFDNMKY